MIEPPAKHVSPSAAPSVVASWIVATVVIVLLIAFARQLFPDEEAISWDVWAAGTGSSRSSVLADLSESAAESRAILREAGFQPSEIHESAPNVDKPENSRGMWTADQRFTVQGHSYARFAKLSDDVVKRDQGHKRVTSSFPPIPFRSVFMWLATLTLIGLCLSVAAQESRDADVTAPPRGMHPIIIAGQTLMFALLVAFSLTYLHTATIVARTPFVVIAAAIIASVSIWVFGTRSYWPQKPLLTLAFRGYLAATAAGVALVAVVLAIGPH